MKIILKIENAKKKQKMKVEMIARDEIIKAKKENKSLI